MPLCPYCAQEKEEAVFTDEHVLPRAMGGALEPTNPFKIRVCGACNRSCGRYVDAPVVRSWYLRLARANALLNVQDPNTGSMMLQFTGPLDGWIEEDTVCDSWIGPTGDNIFHVHRPYPGEGTMVGGAPATGALDPGVVYVGIVATNPAWHPIILRAVRTTFEDAPLVGLNFGPTASNEHGQRIAWIKSLPATRTSKLSLDLACGQRFTAKVALGLGAALLGEGYVTSSDAASLRTYMRSPDAVFRASLGLRGKALLGVPHKQEELTRATFGWRSCHTIALLPMGDRLTLMALLYGTHSMAVAVSTEASIWRGHVADGGLAWVVAPGLRRFAQASVPEILIDIANESPTGVLADLQARIEAVPPRPPVQLEEATG